VKPFQDRTEHLGPEAQNRLRRCFLKRALQVGCERVGALDPDIAVHRSRDKDLEGSRLLMSPEQVSLYLPDGESVPKPSDHFPALHGW